MTPTDYLHALHTACTVLGVGGNASTAQIHAAQRRMSRASHPDAGGDARVFRLVQLSGDLLFMHATRIEVPSGTVRDLLAAAAEVNARPKPEPDSRWIRPVSTPARGLLLDVRV